MDNWIKTPKYSLTGQLILLLAGLYGFMPSTSYADVQCDVFDPGEIRIAPVIMYNTDPITTEKPLYRRGSRMDCLYTPSQDKTGKLVFAIDPAAASNTAYPEVFNTNLAGVGLKYILTGNSKCAIKPGTTMIICDVKFKKSEKLLVHFVINRLLFKTDHQQEFGTINLPPGNIKYYLEEDGSATAKNMPDILGAAQGVVSKNGCTLNTPNLNFDLGEHQQKAFSAVGSLGREITQSIILSCHPTT